MLISSCNKLLFDNELNKRRAKLKNSEMHMKRMIRVYIHKLRELRKKREKKECEEWYDNIDF